MRHYLMSPKIGERKNTIRISYHLSANLSVTHLIHSDPTGLRQSCYFRLSYVESCHRITLVFFVSSLYSSKVTGWPMADASMPASCRS